MVSRGVLWWFVLSGEVVVGWCGFGVFRLCLGLGLKWLVGFSEFGLRGVFLGVRPFGMVCV